MITFLLWKWRDPTYRSSFDARSVNVAAASLSRHCTLPHRVVCITDDPTGIKCETYPIWDDLSSLRNPSGKHLPACFRRLKMFDPAAQEQLKIKLGSLVVSVDLDCVVMLPINKLFENVKTFAGWGVVGQRQPRLINGSLVAFRSGTNSHLWTDFDPNHSPQRAHAMGFPGSDQGWISMMKVGSTDVQYWQRPDGILSYRIDIARRRISWSGARIVFFNGKEKPWQAEIYNREAWVRTHWRE